MRNKIGTALLRNFKLWVVIFIFGLVFLHLYDVIFYSQGVIVQPELLLGLVLGLAVYLWVREVRDRNHLEYMNLALVESQSQLEDAQVNTISVLILTEEAKDPYMKGHSRNVARYCQEMGKALSFKADRQKTLYRAAILHDLGKVGIADEILLKPGKLTNEEWQIMRQHPKKAVDILRPLKFLSEEQFIIYHHHERIDGSGYPEGLKGGDIPLESRIIALADTFDAMNSKRAYRTNLTKGMIFEELQRIKGIQLDEVLVGLFVSLLEKNPSLWERERE